MDLEFTRGDTQLLKLQLKDKNGERLQLATGDMLYFTVRKTPTDKKVWLQKKLGDGITYTEEDNYYRFRLESDDTANMPYGTYGYDIQIKTSEGIVITIEIGSITLTEEYTWKEDE